MPIRDILAENLDELVTEDGDFLVTEDSSDLVIHFFLDYNMMTMGVG